MNLGNPATAQEGGEWRWGQHREMEQEENRERYAIAMQAAVHSVWPWGLQKIGEGERNRERERARQSPSQ